MKRKVKLLSGKFVNWIFKKSTWNSALVICINSGQKVTLVSKTLCTLSALNVYVCFASNPSHHHSIMIEQDHHTHKYQASVLSISRIYGSFWKYGQISLSEAVRWLKCVFVWNRFWKFFQQISHFITVYFDSLSADYLLVWVKRVCVFVCFRCESCVDMLFVRGSGNCVQCNTPLRKSNFRVQLFEDPAIDKEVEIRKKVLKMYVSLHAST